MSNVATADLYAGCPDRESSPGLVLQRYDAIHAMISPRNEVLRLLPHRERRMVGAWCFADIYGPTDVRGQEGMSVPPHPHMVLQTVSWLVRGTVLHRDSLGTTALVEPGRVAVMTAGHGIAHSENSPPDHGPVLHGAQLWVALPEHARHDGRAFTLHEPAPVLEVDGLRAQVFIGALGDVVAPAQGVTPLLGAELEPAAPGRRAGRLPLDPAYEHMLIPLAGEARVGRAVVEAGQALYLGLQRDELDLALSADARVLLLGGVPFEEEIVMWWNLVGRTHEEIEQARRQWNGHEDRFGEVSHYPGPERLAAPELPHVRLRPRGRVS
ncbi:MAG: pirin family protein [Oryzihumus sp.]